MCGVSHTCLVGADHSQLVYVLKYTQVWDIKVHQFSRNLKGKDACQANWQEGNSLLWSYIWHKPEQKQQITK